MSIEEKARKNPFKVFIGGFAIIILFLLIILAIGSYSDLRGTIGQNKDITKLKSEVNKNLTYDIVKGDPDKYKGEIVQWRAKIFTQPEKDNNSISFQAFEGGDDRNFAVIYKGTNLDVKEDDYVIITGELLGKFNGENAFGAKLEVPAVQAFTVEKGTRNDVAAPTINVIKTNDSNTQNKFTISLEKVELAKNETRFLIKLKNDSNSKVSLYDSSSKLTQGAKQYEPESVFDSNQELPSEILPGIEAEGYIVFPTIDPNQKQMTLFLDKPSDENYDLDWQEVKFDINLP